MAEEKKLKIDMILEWLDKSDYYQILNINKDANTDQIKQAYFKLSRQYHPDKFFTLGEEATKTKITQVFKRLNEAHSVLKTPQKRKKYDALVFGPDRQKNLRYTPTEDDRGGPANPLDYAKTPNGKKYLKLVLAAQVKKDWKTVEMNLGFACNFEPDNEYFKKMMNRCKEEIKNLPKEDPFKIR